MTDGPRHVTVGEEDDGQRIDNYLRRQLKGVPKGLIYRLLRTGQVRVNRGRVKAHYRVEPGDSVRLPPVKGRATRAGQVPDRLKHRLSDRILYEDDRLIVINKPSGVPVHGGSGLRYGLIDALREARPDARYLELVHRLDRETSGCLIIAKRRSTLRRLHAALRENRVEKRYQALVLGRWTERETVDAPLARTGRGTGENRVVVSADGKSSRTDFTPVAVFSEWTLVEARLHTGRTHQIRVHATSRGHPLAGDDRYGHADGDRKARNLGLKRLFLHASDLVFDHPDREEQVVRAHAPLDDDLQAIIRKLESQENDRD